MMEMSNNQASRNNTTYGSIASMKSINYDITTINARRGTVKKETKMDDSTIDNGFTPSQRMMAHASVDNIQTSIGDHHRNTKTKLLSTFLNLNKIESIKTINTNQNDTKIYL
jgi:hypothetical protein